VDPRVDLGIARPPRLFAGFVAVMCLAVISLGLEHTGRSGSQPGAAMAQTPTAPAIIRSDWSLPLQGFHAASFSPDDAFFTVVGDPKGWVSLRRVDKQGALVWSKQITEATDAVVGPGGDTVVAYAMMDPTRPAVDIIRGANKNPDVYHYPLDSAVWGATVSSDGNYAAIVTGGHTLYVISLRGQPSCVQHDLMGSGDTVAISRDSSFIASGTWDESGVVCCNLQGAELWHYQEHDGEMNRLFEAQIAKREPYVLGLSYDNAQHCNAMLYLWRESGRGKPLWVYPLGPDDSDPETLIAADGSRVAVAYVHRIVHGDKTLPVRELAILNRYVQDASASPVSSITLQQSALWTKGGALMSPHLVAISADGEVVTVRDDRRTLYNFDANGKISTSYPMPAAIVDTEASDDGTCLLVHTSDSKLTLLHPA
jgi:hypothetical protein